MQNKKGIVRVIESAIAVLILLGFVLFVVSRQVQAPDTAENVYKIQHQILREVSEDYNLRSSLIQGKENETYNYIGERLKPFPIMFSIHVCDPDEYCGCKEGECPDNREIYADEILISTNLSDYHEVKLALFSWLLPGTFVPREVPQAPSGGGGDGPSCGNNDQESGEVCDGTDLNSQTCITQGFNCGTLKCSSNCLSYDTSECKISVWSAWSVCQNIGGVWAERSTDSACNMPAQTRGTTTNKVPQGTNCNVPTGCQCGDEKINGIPGYTAVCSDNLDNDGINGKDFEESDC